MHTVNKIAKLTGVTLRTLRYYDKIGLLVPSSRTDAGYRLYSAEDLEKLQQILFFKELNFPLERIAEIISKPDFDRKRALTMQVRYLEGRAERYRKLSQLARETLEHLEGGLEMKQEELFNGFDYEKMQEEQKQYEEEVKTRWGHTDAYRISKERTSKMTKEDWERIGAEQDANLKILCDLYQEKAGIEDPRVQNMVKNAIAFIDTNFYPCSLEMMSNLGNMYIADERFKAFYDKFAPGLAEYYNEAIQHYCITHV